MTELFNTAISPLYFDRRGDVNPDPKANILEAKAPEGNSTENGTSGVEVACPFSGQVISRLAMNDAGQLSVDCVRPNVVFYGWNTNDEPDGESEQLEIILGNIKI